MPEKKTKKTPTVKWRCPVCSLTVEQPGNVTAHSHACGKSTVQLERID